MKKVLKNGFVFFLSLSLALGFCSMPAFAQSVKGVVTPLTTIVNAGGGQSALSSWNEGRNFSSDFDSYKVSADVYIPRSAFSRDGGMFFIDPQVQFWFEDLGVNAYLENDTSICVGYDFENNCPYFHGLIKGEDKEVENLPFVKDVKAMDDMIIIQIADAPVNPSFKTAEFDPNTGFNKVWTDPIPTAGDAVVQIKVGTDRANKYRFAVANASIKIGNKEYKTNYSKSADMAGFNGDDGSFKPLKASAFNTSALSVSKTSVKVKKKKSIAFKVSTMFSGDKVSVSSSSAKVAKAKYKSGKVTITGIKKGKATISVKAYGVTKTINVTVK